MDTYEKTNENMGKITKTIEIEITLEEAEQAVADRLIRIAQVQANLDYENEHLAKEQEVVAELKKLGIKKIEPVEVAVE